MQASAEHPNDPFYPVVTATLETTVFDVVHMFSKFGISAVPITDKDGTVINMYETVDVIVSSPSEGEHMLFLLRIDASLLQTLVRSGSYQSLDLTVGAALLQRSPDFPGVITCTPQDSLASLMLLLKQRRVHRLVVVEGDDSSKGRDRGRGEWTDRDRSVVRDESIERSPPTVLPGSAPATGGGSQMKNNKGRLVGIITLSDVLRYIVGHSEESEEVDGLPREASGGDVAGDLSSFPLRGEPSSRDRSRSALDGEDLGSGVSTPGLTDAGGAAPPG